jgi:hypothetical protein
MKRKKPIQALNEKARAIQSLAEGEEKSVKALQDGPPPMPVGCTTIFDVFGERFSWLRRGLLVAGTGA